MPNQTGQQEMLKIEKISHRPAVGWILFAWMAIAPAFSAINFSHALHSYSPLSAWLGSAPISALPRETSRISGLAHSAAFRSSTIPRLALRLRRTFTGLPCFKLCFAGVYRIFGVSEAVSHALMFVILILNTFLLGLLAHRCAGIIAAQFACLAWLGCGVMGLYSHLVWNLHLMLGLVFLALLGFVNAESNWRWAVVGASSFAAAIASSWEAVFVCPGYWTAASGAATE